MEEEIKDRAEVTSQDENTVQNGEKMLLQTMRSIQQTSFIK